MNEFYKKDLNKILLFSLDESRYALYVSDVEKIIYSIAITPLPKAPEIILGIINFKGEIIPVVDIRKRFRLPSKERNLDERFIIARTLTRFVVLVVDSVEDVYELDKHQFTDARSSLPYADYLKGIAKIEKNIVLISDLEAFLSLDECKLLDLALSGASG